MVTAPTGPVTYAGLWDRARELLSPLGLADSAAPPAWSGATGLTTAVWRLGGRGAALAECRVMKLAGPAADAFLAVIYPTDPTRLPAFSAELCAGGGRPALAYFDLPSPALPPGLRNEVADQTTVLSIRHAPFLPRDEAPPIWVMDDSPGGFLFTQTADRDAPARLSQAFEDYLNVWIDFAFPFAHAAAFALAANPAPAGAKKRFNLHAPTRAMLAQHLGPDWAGRFVAEFLQP